MRGKCIQGEKKNVTFHKTKICIGKRMCECKCVSDMTYDTLLHVIISSCPVKTWIKSRLMAEINVVLDQTGS